MDNIIKKNLFDLEFQKYIQYFNTSIIILFTYFIAVGIALLTGQLDFNNVVIILISYGVSVFVLSITILVMFNAKMQLKQIPLRIEKL